MTTDKPARSRRKRPETPGERLRTAIIGRYTLDPAEELLLDEAVALADALDRLNREVAAEKSFVVKGSRGQPVVSALLDGQRKHAEVLARLLESLALPQSPDEEQGETLTTKRARRAARARWDAEGRRGG
jgi:hypothetical protein